MKFTQATILLCGVQLAAARAIIQTRSQWCQAIGKTTTSNSGGGPGQEPFTNTASDLVITREGNGVWSDGGRNNLYYIDTLTVDIAASDWGGQDPIEWQSTFDPYSVSLTSCSITDHVGNQNYQGYANSWFDDNYVTVQYSTCTVNFLC